MSLEETFGSVDIHSAIRVDRGDEGERHERTGVENHDVARGIGFDVHHDAAAHTGRVDDLGAEELIDPDHATVVDAWRRENDPSPSVSFVARVDPIELDNESRLVSRRGQYDQRAS